MLSTAQVSSGALMLDMRHTLRSTTLNCQKVRRKTRGAPDPWHFTHDCTCSSLSFAARHMTVHAQASALLLGHNTEGRVSHIHVSTLAPRVPSTVALRVPTLHIDGASSAYFEATQRGVSCALAHASSHSSWLLRRFLPTGSVCISPRPAAAAPASARAISSAIAAPSTIERILA